MCVVAAQLLAPEGPPELQIYCLRLKAEELLYLFLVELVNRSPVPPARVSAADARRLYHLRGQVVADQSTPPHLPTLACAIGLSSTKMKRLFKQVFSTTIYAYYQTLRLQEATRLLQHPGVSVAEVGYQLGFRNLSHFTQLFAGNTAASRSSIILPSPNPTQRNSTPGGSDLNVQ